MTQAYRLTNSRDGWAVNVSMGDLAPGRAFVAGYVTREFHATKFDQFDRELAGKTFYAAQTLNGIELKSDYAGVSDRLFLTRADAAQVIADRWQTTREEVLAARAERLAQKS